MKTIITLLCLIYGSLLTAQTAKLTVEVTNIKTLEGKMRVALFNGESSYLKDADYEADTVIYDSGAVLITFKDLPLGEYAISLYHDQNDNGKLDANFMGIPSEPYAFSNNAPSRFGPAKYEEARFTLINDENKQQIKLN
ncbi:DUF2141 domain-containing protein [Marinoscillum sp.]|uniref:DUF2141 domain-containing protein n=1 Tax=Marinoscillum sp. TaxID=2024838 RepID=UPI003BAA8931